MAGAAGVRGAFCGNGAAAVHVGRFAVVFFLEEAIDKRSGGYGWRDGGGGCRCVKDEREADGVDEEVALMHGTT